jgi:hypothetical protein
MLASTFGRSPALPTEITGRFREVVIERCCRGPPRAPEREKLFEE